MATRRHAKSTKRTKVKRPTAQTKPRRPRRVKLTSRPGKAGAKRRKAPTTGGLIFVC